jgi:putative transposase
MPQTYTQLHYHLVFATKERRPTITSAIQPRLWEYLGGVVRGERGIPLQIGGVADHVHLLLTLRQDVAVSDFMRKLKSVSSGWAHETFPNCGLWWQDGYGAFTVSHSAVEKVREYIENQEEHHRNQSFESEFRWLLKKHGVDFREQYL